jgi:hypothetical protein
MQLAAPTPRPIRPHSATAQELRHRRSQARFSRGGAELYFHDFLAPVEQPRDEVQFALQACEIGIRADRQADVQRESPWNQIAVLAAIAACSSRSPVVTARH